jgi:hypothetical protein
MVIPGPEWIAQGARWARQAYRAARRHASRDHGALWTGWYAKGYVDSFGEHFYAIAACAPSEHLRRPQEVSAARVNAFLSEHIPLVFPSQPFQSYPDMVMYEMEDTEQGSSRHAARVLPSGLVELFVRVPHETDVNGAITVNLVDAFQPLAWLLAAVNEKGYRTLFRLRTTFRLLDWYAALSPTISTSRGTERWTDLHFPGRRPQLRGTQGVTPNRGFVEHNQRQTVDPRRVLANAVTAYVRASGWDGDDVPGAVADTVDALQSTSPENRARHRR